MTIWQRRLSAVALLLGVMFVSSCASRVAADTTIVQPGQLLEVVWGCSVDGCASWVLKVETMREDKWAEVRQCLLHEITKEVVCMKRWKVNFTQALAFRVYVAEGAAVSDQEK